MNIVSLNIRGIGGPAKWRYGKEIISKNEVGMVCIQETKVGTINREKCFAIWGDDEYKWIDSPAENSGGGILTIWGKNKFKCEKSISKRGFIITIGKWGKDNIQVNIINVYLPCEINEKRHMWEDMIKYKEDVGGKVWCIFGDFNVVRNLEERKGVNHIGSCSRSEIQGFNEFIERMELIDLPLVGRNYTWYKTNGSAKSRLDRMTRD